MRPSSSLSPRAQQILQWVRDTTKASKRNHVNSELLCADALHVLRSSLPEPYTYDIIDVNPGTCLWSQALHDAVKPRRHILVEPARPVYAPFIEPLLDKPNSPYRWAPDLATVLDEGNGLLSPEVTAVKATGPRTQFLNKNLLMTANLTPRNPFKIGVLGTMAKEFLVSRWYRSTYGDTERFMHKYGMIRLLAWMDDDTRRALLPHVTGLRSRMAMQLDAAAEVTEVVGASRYSPALFSIQRRWHELDLENLADVTRLQQDTGIDVPVHRQPAPPTPPWSYYQPSPQALKSVHSTWSGGHDRIKEIFELEQRIQNDDPEWLARWQEYWQAITVSEDPDQPEVMPTSQRVNGPRRNTADQKDLVALCHTLKWKHRGFHRSRRLIHQHRDLWHKLLDASSAQNPDQAQVSALLAEYVELDRFTMANRSSIRLTVRKAVDDYRAYDTPGISPLAFNRRPFEPLVPENNEFTGARPLALVDIQPRLSFPHRLYDFETQVCFDDFLFDVNRAQRLSVRELARSLFAEDADQILSRIDGLTDIQKGGFPNLDLLRVRSLHRDFLFDIAVQYAKWPYRPPIEQLLTAKAPLQLEELRRSKRRH